MSEDAPENPSREERLAAKLRENLKRRKAQAKAMQAESSSKTPLSKPDNRS